MPARRYRHQDGDALLLQLKAGHNAARARLASMVHLHLETHAAPPCSRWARLVSTATTARLGAPFFAQKTSLLAARSPVEKNSCADRRNHL